MSEVIDKIVQAQQAEMDEEVANDQVRRLTGQILEDLVGPIHLVSKVVLQKLSSTARWLDHAVDTELERRVEIRNDYLEKDEDEEPDGFLSAIRAEMTRRGKATELRNGQLWMKQDGPQLDRLEDMCDVHRRGEVLWDIAERLTGLGLEVGLLPDEEDARNGTIIAGLPPSGRLVFLPFVWGRRNPGCCLHQDSRALYCVPRCARGGLDRSQERRPNRKPGGRLRDPGAVLDACF